MAGSRTGTATIVKHAREIARLFTTYGASDLTARTSSDFATCITGLVACYQVLRTTDDFLLMVDFTNPLGPEDVGPP